jgi:hypothetical protein
VDLSYFRDRDGAEVDLIVEDRRTGELVAGNKAPLSGGRDAGGAFRAARLALRHVGA